MCSIYWHIQWEDVVGWEGGGGGGGKEGGGEGGHQALSGRHYYGFKSKVIMAFVKILYLGTQRHISGDVVYIVAM